MFVLGKCLFKSSPYILIVVVVFFLLLLLSCVSSLYVLDISSLFNTRFARLPGGALYRNLPTNAGVMGVIPGLERFHMPWRN